MTFLEETIMGDADYYQKFPLFFLLFALILLLHPGEPGAEFRT